MKDMIAITDRIKIVLWNILLFVVTFFLIQFLIYYIDGNEFYLEISSFVMIGFDVLIAIIVGLLTLTLVRLPYSENEADIIDNSVSKINYLGFSVRCMFIYSILNLVLAVTITLVFGNLFIPDMKIDILSTVIYGLKECYRGGALFTFVAVVYLINKSK